MTAQTQTEQQFYQDAPVHDAAGEKVGTLHAYDPEGGYITVQKGFLFHKDLYIPLTAVQGTDADGNIHLSLHKDDLADDRYNDPPAAGMASSAAGEDSYAQRTTVADTTTTRTQAAPAPMPAPAPRQTPPVAPADDTIAVPVYEEQLTVGKRQEEVGQVHLHKEVVQEQQTANVSLRHEEVTVERVPFTGQASEADLQNAFQGGRDIEIPVMGEEAVVGKQARVVEEVRLHKDEVSETERVSDTVRKERVVVDEVDTTTAGTQRRR